MVQFRKLDMDGRKKEKIVYQNQMLHYGLYVPRPEAYFFGDIPWHWHDEFEFGHILGGSMQYKTNHSMNSYCMRGTEYLSIPGFCIICILWSLWRR